MSTERIDGDFTVADTATPQDLTDTSWRVSTDGHGVTTKTQVSTVELFLQELPGHDHALDLVGALVDLGDRGPWDSFRR
jgi:hypothetical protein